MIDWQIVRNGLIDAGLAVQTKLMHSLQHQDSSALSEIHKEAKEDVIFNIDRDVEADLLTALNPLAEIVGGILLIAEGISQGDGLVLPIHSGFTKETAAVRIIIDPIDGTRGIMYNKRPAWFLAGAALNKGVATMLSDIETCVMVELPTTKMYLADSLSCIKGQGVKGFRRNVLTGTQVPFQPTPSKAMTLQGGFAQIARFTGPGRDILARIDDDLLLTLHPEGILNKVLIFEDQYISTGGQLYEVLAGHDRFIADIRHSLGKVLIMNGKSKGYTCHPYDACCSLIATEAGCVITDIHGNPFDAPMDLLTPVEWILYANEELRKVVWPVLKNILVREGFIES